MSPNYDCIKCPELTFDPGGPYPNETAFLEAITALGFFGGAAFSVVLAVFLVTGARRYLAIATLVCLVGFGLYSLWATRFGAFGGLLIMTTLMLLLVSVVYWPVRSHWVNLPLVCGCAVSSVSLVMLATTRNGFY